MILASRSSNTTCCALQGHCHDLYCYRAAEQLTHASQSASLTARVNLPKHFPAVR